MANPFGEVVDDETLKKMERYIGQQTITQEDRAREAIDLMYEGRKSIKAEKYLDELKNYDGSVVSTVCSIYNATGDTLDYVSYYDWSGHIGRTPYPIMIGNGQWAAFHHIHWTGNSACSEAGVVYRAKKDGRQYDIVLAWSTPSEPSEVNKAYCEVVEAVNPYFSWDSWQGIRVRLHNNGVDSHTANHNGIFVEADTDETGYGPMFTATIKIAFDP